MALYNYQDVILEDPREYVVIRIIKFQSSWDPLVLDKIGEVMPYVCF